MMLWRYEGCYIVKEILIILFKEYEKPFPQKERPFIFI